MSTTAVTTSVLLDHEPTETTVPMSYAARVLSVEPELDCLGIRVYYLDYVENGVHNPNGHARKFWVVEADIEEVLPKEAAKFLGTVQVMGRYTRHVWSDR